MTDIATIRELLRRADLGAFAARRVGVHAPEVAEGIAALRTLEIQFKSLGKGDQANRAREAWDRLERATQARKVSVRNKLASEAHNMVQAVRDEKCREVSR